jgi:hypothetical protein
MPTNLKFMEAFVGDDRALANILSDILCLLLHVASEQGTLHP